MIPINITKTLDSLIQRADEAKAIARLKDKSPSFMVAAGCYLEAANIVSNIVLPGLSESDAIVYYSAKEHYYRYEYYDCLYGSNDKLNPIIIELADNARIELDKSMAFLNSPLKHSSENLNALILEMKKLYKVSTFSVVAKKKQAMAINAIENKNYIIALDEYRDILKLYKSQYEYCEQANLSATYIRIAKGNYFLSASLASKVLLSIYITKLNSIQPADTVSYALYKVLENSEYDLSKFDKTYISKIESTYNLINDLLLELLNSLSLNIEGFKMNPEMMAFVIERKNIEDGLNSLLENNRSLWFNFLIDNNWNELLIKIMKKKDIDYFKKLEAKMELEKSNYKIIIIMGGFWLSVLISIGYLLMIMAESGISIFRFLVIIFSLPLMFLMVGALTLKSTNSLKEESFLELMKLALKINFKGLSSFSKQIKK